MMFQNGGLPFSPTGTQAKKPALDVVLEDLVNRVIDDRLLFAGHRHYFMEPDKIVTAAVMRSTIQAEASQLRAELPYLIKRVLRESLPRGLRWIIR
jgi:hypothetical protein